MAHFAELDENNEVVRVIVVDNNDTSNSDGEEVEQIGISFLKGLFGIIPTGSKHHITEISEFVMPEEVMCMMKL